MPQPQVQDSRNGDRDLRAKRAGGDGRCHRVCRVVETVGEVEDQRGDNDQHDDRG
jgi:hypothetical protein